MHLQHSTSVCLPSPAAVLLHRAEPHAQHLPVVHPNGRGSGHPPWLWVTFLTVPTDGSKPQRPPAWETAPPSPFPHSAALCRDKHCSAASSKSSSMAPFTMFCCSVLVCQSSTLVSTTPCSAAGLGQGGCKAAWGCWVTAA